ncbi:Cell death protease [Phlyctochytrium planicorne]|nr:Cell death protease [Phlyctochytrium planicorne]
MDGMFLENGLLRAGEDGSTVSTRPFSWHHGATVIFLDQPVGTGYSTPGKGYEDRDLNAVTAHFVSFLDNFFAIWPHLRSSELYLAGESFAGVYIPYFAKAIISRNQNVKTSKTLRYKLSGIAIGSGWMDPIRQYSAYIEYGTHNGLIPQAFQVNQVVGDKDLICNVVGINWMVGNLTWNGAQGMQGAPILDWRVNGTPAGTYQTARNLTNVIMFNTSHMAAVDHPLESLDVFNRMINYLDTVYKYDSALVDPSKPSKPKPGEESEPKVDQKPNSDADEYPGGDKSESGGFIATAVVISFLVIAALVVIGLRTKRIKLDWLRGFGFSRFMPRRVVDERSQWHELSATGDDEDESFAN